MTRRTILGPSALSARILVRGVYVHVYAMNREIFRLYLDPSRAPAEIGRYYIPAKIRCFHVSGYISRAWEESGEEEDLSLLEEESQYCIQSWSKLKSDFLEPVRAGLIYATVPFCAMINKNRFFL